MDPTSRPARNLRSVLDRRAFLIGGSAVALAACASDTPAAPGSTTSAGSTPATVGESVTLPSVDLSPPVTLGPDGPPFPQNQTSLGARFPDGVRAPSGFVAGVEARMPFVALDVDQFPLRDTAPDAIDVVIQREGVVIHEETVEVRARGEFTPYYPITFTPDIPGQYVVVSNYAEVPSWFGVVDRDAVAVPQIGDMLPGFDTPTFDNPEGVELLCTQPDDPCPFHDITLTDALAAGPVAFLIATPAFCQTDTCGPSLDYLIELAPQFPDITFLHSEVFAEDINAGDAGQLPALAPVVNAYQMPWEPALFVADETGAIATALHWAMSREDMAAALAVI